MTWQPCPVCGCLGMGPFGMAMHLARRHPEHPPADTSGFKDAQVAQIDQCRADSRRLNTAALVLEPPV